MDETQLNAYNMYRVHIGEPVPFARFQLELIRQIIEKYKRIQPIFQNG